MNKNVLSPKLMVVGVDGMDPRLSKKYLAEGKMPNLQKIIDMGAQREDLVLIGAQPTVTPPQWTTLAVGAYPSTHGITQFSRTVPGLITQYGYNLDSRLCKAEPIWNCLVEDGRKVCVFHWPGSAWPPTSDSENLMVIDGAAPGSVGVSSMQVDVEMILGANTTVKEPTFELSGSPDAAQPCVINRDEEYATSSQGGGDLAESMQNMMSNGTDKLYELQDQGVDTIPIIHDPNEGFGTRSDALLFPTSICLSPIKDATGWTIAVPEGAKEFTLLTCGGVVRRVGLIVKDGADVYNKVLIYKNKKAITPLAECVEGKMTYNVVDELIYHDRTVTANRHYKVLELKEDGSELRMYISPAMEFGADSVIHPKRLYQALLDNVGPYPPQSMMYLQDKDIKQATFDVWDYVVDWYVKAFDYLIENEETEYIFSHLHSVDIVEHTFIRYMKNLGFNKYSEDVYADWMETLYKQVDRYLGGLMHHVENGWSIIVTSDHAQVAPSYIPPGIGDMSGVNTSLLSELGYTVITKDEKGNKKIDWSKTRAIASQGNDIFINLKGREAYGIVEPEDQWELEEQIITDLYSYKHPDSGKRVIALALRNKDAILLGYGGPTAGDICFWTADGYSYDHCDGLSTGIGEASTSLSPIFVAAGPGFKKSFTTDRVIRQVDVAPTIAYLAGVRMPAQCEGAPIYQIIDDEI